MGTWKKPFCPICGLTHGKVVPRDKDGRKIGEENFWEKTRDYHGEKPFGVIMESQGRGTLRRVGYYDVTEDEEGYFPLIKIRLLNVINEWLEKKWLSKNEIEKILAKF